MTVTKNLKHQFNWIQGHFRRTNSLHPILSVISVLERGCETCCQSCHIHISISQSQAVWMLKFCRVWLLWSGCAKGGKILFRSNVPCIRYWLWKYCKVNDQAWAVSYDVVNKGKGLKKCTCWERKSYRKFSAEVKCIIGITPTQAVWERRSADISIVAAVSEISQSPF